MFYNYKSKFNSSLNDHLKDHFDFILGGINEPFWKTVKTINDNMIDYHYEDDTMLVSLPGFSKKELNIEIDGDTLNISSDVPEESTNVFKKSFKKSFKVPANLNLNDVSASMSDGILEIKFGKKVEPKKIKIV